MTTDEEVIKYFTEKGFDVDWDQRWGGSWHEFCYEGKLLVQLDRGIPLRIILRDLKHYAEHGNLPDDPEWDYIINAPPDDFDKFLTILGFKHGL
jgi:hypothetical protein